MQKLKQKTLNYNSKAITRNFYFWFVVLPFVFCILSFMGCATVPTKEALPTYNINGTAYLPLVSLCDLRHIDLDDDTFTKTVTLSKDSHRLNLMVGDTLVLVDGIPSHLKYPVDIYQGTVVVPYKFKEQVLDVLFKEPAYSTKTTQAPQPLSKIKKVVIDAGHGGQDPGTIGKSGLREKDVNLDIAKRLSSLLRAEGIEVVMTRSTDNFISLQQRVEITNNSRADLFVSIHANANRVRSLNGFEIYYISEGIDDSQRALSSARDAVLNLDSSYFYHPSTDLKAIVWDMIYNYNRAESMELVQSIRRNLDSNLPTRVLRIKGARFYVLKGVRIPAVLIEIGFLSNSKEERMLKNDYYRQNIADAIVRGIKDYAKEYTLMEAAK
jgi:N-acetylmuramoyl-L-alanine amidase